MPKAKKTNLLMQKVINKNIFISKRFKSKIQASAILSEYETKASSDLRDMINQSKIRSERMRIGNYLSSIIDNTKGQFDKISTNILSDALYKNNEDFHSQAEILKRVTERESISEAKVIMNEIYKSLLPKVKFKFTKSNEENTMPKRYSPKILISNKKYILKELENDKMNLNKKIEKYLDEANAFDSRTHTFLPSIHIKNNIRMLDYNPKDGGIVKPIQKNVDLFDMNELKKYTKLGMIGRKRHNKSNDESEKKNEIIENIPQTIDDNNSNNDNNNICNGILKRYYGNTINLVKKEAYGNIFYRNKMLKKSQSADQLIELQLREINVYESKTNFIMKYLDLVKQKISSFKAQKNSLPKIKSKEHTNIKDKDKEKNSIPTTKETSKPKLNYDLRLFDEHTTDTIDRKLDYTPKDFNAKNRSTLAYVDEYSRLSSMNEYLKEASKYLGSKIYSKKQMNNQLNKFYSYIKPININIQHNDPIETYTKSNINNIITTLATRKNKSENNGPLSTNSYNSHKKNYENVFQSEYDETTGNFN